jgi:hypothetical protein
MWKTLAMLVGVMVLLGLGIIFFRGKKIGPRLAGITPTPTVTVVEKTGLVWGQSESEKAARDFVLNSPTYHFDGFNLELKSSQPLYCGDDCWEFTYTFQSRHAGFGNREGLVLAQVITPHQIIVTLRSGQITEAVTDGKFAELAAAVK